MRQRSFYDEEGEAKDARDDQAAMLKRAALCAFRSDMSHRHGCVIVEAVSRRVVSTGYNHKSNHLFHTFSVHAEVDALRKVKKATLSEQAYPALEMYVVRIGANSLGEPLRMSMPCKACKKAIQQKAPNIKKVFYSVNEDAADAASSSPPTSFAQTAQLPAAS
jgi:deoxycytidylate deaminase